MLIRNMLCVALGIYMYMYIYICVCESVTHVLHVCSHFLIPYGYHPTSHVKMRTYMYLLVFITVTHQIAHYRVVEN